MKKQFLQRMLMLLISIVVISPHVWGTDFTFSGAYDGTGNGSWNTTTSTTPIVTVTKDISNGSKTITCVNASSKSYPNLNGNAKYIKFSVPAGYRITNANVTWMANASSQKIIAIFGQSLSGPTSSVVTATYGGYVISNALASSGNTTCNDGEDFAISAANNAREIMFVRVMTYNATTYSSGNTKYASFPSKLQGSADKTYTTAVGNASSAYFGKVVLTVESTAPSFSVDEDAELAQNEDEVTLTSAGTTIYYKWSTNASAYAANAGSTLAAAADGYGASAQTVTAPNGTGTYYLYAVAKDESNNYSAVVKRSYTITAAAASADYCISVYNADVDEKIWDGFTEIATNHFTLSDFVVPGSSKDGWTKYWVGEDGAWSSTFSANAGMSSMNLYPATTATLGEAAGAVGTLHLWDDTKTSGCNLWVKFEPDGYGMTYGGNNYAFKTTATDHMLETDVVTLPNVSTTYNIGLKTSSSYVKGGLAKSTDEAISAMGTTTVEGGLRKIWLYSTADSWIGSNAKMAIWDVTNSHWGDNTDAHKFMTKVNDNLWYGYVPTDAEKIILVRVNPSNDDPAWDWGQSHDIIPGDVNNYVHINGNWSNSKAEYTIGSTHPATGDKGKFRMWDNSDADNWYVHWIPYYVLSYDGNGGSESTAQTERNSESSTTTVKVASNGFTAPTGYTFKGWATSDSRADAGTVDYDAGDDYTLTANATLYAAWNPKSCTVTFNTNGGSGTITSVTATYDAVMPSKASNLPTKTGYTFGGFFDGEGGTGTKYYNADGTSAHNWDKNTTSTTTLYAKWTANTPTITLDDQDATNTPTGSVVATYGSAMPSIATLPTKTGYTFGGFYSDVAGGGTQYYTSTGASAKNSDLASATTLYALWTQSVTIDDNGGSANGSVSVTYKGTAGTPSVPTYAGHTVDLGYYAESSCTNKVMALDGTLQTNVTDGSSVVWTNSSSKWAHAGASTLYAHWKCNTPSISCTANTVTITIPNDTKVYYTTDGSTPDDGDDEYTESFTIDADVTVKAIAIQSGCTSSAVASADCEYTDTKCYVTYAAGVTLTSGDVPTDGTGYTSGAEVTVKGNTGSMVYTGYTFRGWTDGTTFFLAGQKFNISANTTLTAVWDEPVSDCKTWSGSPNTFTDGSMTVSTNLILTSGSISDPSSVDIYSGTKATCFVIDGASRYLEGHLNDGSEISSVTISAATNQSSAKKYAIVFSTSSDFSSTVTVYEHTAPSKDDARDDSKLIHEFTAPSGAKYFRVYRKFVYDETQYGENQTIRVYGVEVCKAGGGYANFTVSFADQTGFAGSSTLPGNIVGVPTGKKIIQPANPTAAGYIFGGWYSNAACTSGNEINWSTMTISADKTIYAKWTAKTQPTQYTVSIDAATVCSGSSTNIKMTSSQSGVSYQLYKGEDKVGDAKAGGSALTWSSISATGTYKVMAVENETYAACEMSNNVSLANYDAVSIKTDPTSEIAATVDVGSDMSVVLNTGTFNNATYKWQTCTDATPSSASDISSGSQYANYNTATMTFTPAAEGTYYFRCKVTDDCGTTVYSNVATVTASVAKEDPEVYEVSGTTSICSGETATITLADSEDDVTYQLYKGGVAEGDPVTGTGSALEWEVTADGTYTVKAEEDEDYNEADMDGSAVISYKTATSIDTDPATAVTGHDGVNFTLGSGMEASGQGDLSYKWYSYTSSGGADKAVVAGATEATYTTSKSAGTYYYKVEVTAACGSVESSMITVTIDNKHKLTYDANGGSGAPEAEYRAAGSAALSATEPTRDGYRFLGWNTEDDGTGDHYDAGASYTMGSSAVTLYAEWGETATLTWNLNVNTEESSIGTASKASTNARISNSTDMTNLANYGSLTITGSKKENLTSKIGTPASYDADKYMYVTFDVPDDYEFVSTSISVKAQPVSTNKDVKLILTDGVNTITKTQTNLSSGDITTVTETNSDETAFTGTVTLKIYCYGATNDYRLGSPITIAGNLNYVCPERATITSPTAPQSIKLYTDQSKTLTVSATAYSSGTLHYQWKKDGVNIVGATSASHTVYGSIDGTVGETYVYTCDVTQTSPDACATVTSPAVSITFASTSCGYNVLASATRKSGSTNKMENGSGPYYSASGVACESDGKLGTDGSHYMYITLTGTALQDGDVVVINLNTVSGIGDGAIHLFAGTTSGSIEIGTKASPTTGDNEVTLSSVPENTYSVTLYRTDKNQNHKVDGIKVKRYTCPDIFIYDDAAGTHEWSDEDNWIGPAGHGSGLPTSEDRIFINKSVTVDVATASAAEMHITNGSMVTVEKSITVGDVIIETGSTLNIAKDGDDGITVATNSLYLKGGWNSSYTTYDMPRIYIDPLSTLTKEEDVVNFDISVNHYNYYPIAVPFRVKVSDVDYANSFLAGYSNYGAAGQYVIKEYDGQRRAEKGPDQVNNWKVVPLKDDENKDVYLEPGKGYIMTAVSLPDYGGGVIRFPLSFGNAWTALGEQGTVSAVTKNVVVVTAWTGKATEGDKKVNKGWNLLGVPFMSCYATDEVGNKDAIIQGRYDFKNNTWIDGTIRYVNVPVHDFSEYIQTDITSAGSVLRPGWCFFVQIETGGNLTFLTADQAASSSLPIYAPKRGMKADMPTVETGIILSNGEKSDKTTFLVSDKYNGAEYEINADLEKLFGNGYTLATYSISGETRLAYNAMSNADAANIIPIGYRAPAEGEYTFSINPRYAQNGAFESVNLIDYETGIITDLLQYSYSFSTDRTQNDARFALNVVKQKETPTGIENGANGANDANGVRKLLIDGKMYIILNGKMFDATGRMVK